MDGSGLETWVGFGARHRSAHQMRLTPPGVLAGLRFEQSESEVVVEVAQDRMQVVTFRRTRWAARRVLSGVAAIQRSSMIVRFSKT